MRARLLAALWIPRVPISHSLYASISDPLILDPSILKRGSHYCGSHLVCRRAVVHRKAVW
jgi:hypothetical protein